VARQAGPTPQPQVASPTYRFASSSSTSGRQAARWSSARHPIPHRRFDAQDGGRRPSKAIKSSLPLSETLGTTSTPFPRVISVAPETLDPVFIGAITAGHLEAGRVSLKLRIG
jgi:hypothetical protein